MKIKHKVFSTDEALVAFLNKDNIIPISTHTTPFIKSFEVDGGDSWDVDKAEDEIEFKYNITLIYKKDKRKFI